MAESHAEVVFARQAEKDYRRIPAERRAQIRDHLARLAADALTNLDIKPLQGHRPWLRLRVGDYRVVYRHAGKAILVARVVPRQELDSAIVRLR